jgi:hypothetical protein
MLFYRVSEGHLSIRVSILIMCGVSMKADISQKDKSVPLSRGYTFRRPSGREASKISF